MNSNTKLLIVVSSILAASLLGCSTSATSEAMGSLKLKDTSTATGCKFITNKQISSCGGIGAPEQLRNTKNIMLNTVIKEKGNAYIVNELSSGIGRCGSADVDIYLCPDEYNQYTYSRIEKNPKNETIDTKLQLKMLYKNELITKDEYNDKRRLLLDDL